MTDWVDKKGKRCRKEQDREWCPVEARAHYYSSKYNRKRQKIEELGGQEEWLTGPQGSPCKTPKLLILRVAPQSLFWC